MANINYRIPLKASPAGDEQTYTDETDGQQKIRIVNPKDTQGWVATTANDPSGTFFKYNVGKDTSLSIIWSIPTELISFAHLEVNGVVSRDVLITSQGIYWRTNRFGTVPWKAGNSLTLDCISSSK